MKAQLTSRLLQEVHAASCSGPSGLPSKLAFVPDKIVAMRNIFQKEQCDARLALECANPAAGPWPHMQVHWAVHIDLHSSVMALNCLFCCSPV